MRSARALGRLLALPALPAAAEAEVDLAAAPRRALVVALQLALVLGVGVPLVAVTVPFLPTGVGAAVLVVVVGSLGFSFWRRANDLHEHVRAGAQVLMEVLGRRAESGEESADLAEARSLLPGMGQLGSVALSIGSHAVGCTLAALDLRGRTGASVIAIHRGRDGVLVPTGREALQAGDVLALSGTEDAVEAARSHLLHGAPTQLAQSQRSGTA